MVRTLAAEEEDNEIYVNDRGKQIIKTDNPRVWCTQRQIECPNCR